MRCARINRRKSSSPSGGFILDCFTARNDRAQYTRSETWELLERVHSSPSVYAHGLRDEMPDACTGSETHGYRNGRREESEALAWQKPSVFINPQFPFLAVSFAYVDARLINFSRQQTFAISNRARERPPNFSSLSPSHRSRRYSARERSGPARSRVTLVTRVICTRAVAENLGAVTSLLQPSR